LICKTPTAKASRKGSQRKSKNYRIKQGIKERKKGGKPTQKRTICFRGPKEDGPVGGTPILKKKRQQESPERGGGVGNMLENSLTVYSTVGGRLKRRFKWRKGSTRGATLRSWG